MTEAPKKIQVDSEVAEELFHVSVGNTVGPWRKEADQDLGSGRWDRHMWLVFSDEDGHYWSVEYSLGLTENQENEFPWTKDMWTQKRPSTVEAFRVVPRIETVVHFDKVQ